MARYYGKIGFAQPVETSPGVWEEKFIEHDYYGSVSRASRSLVAGQSINDDVSISNQIMIVADAFATLNAFAMRYAVWQGVRWRVVNIEISRPRITITLGGEFNGTESGPSV